MSSATRSSTRHSRMSLGGFSDPSLSSEDEEQRNYSPAYEESPHPGDVSFSGSLYPLSPELAATEEMVMPDGEEHMLRPIDELGDPAILRTPAAVIEQEYLDLRDFCTKNVPLGERILCRIVRRKEGVRKLYPRYELFLEPTRDPITGSLSGSVFLMSATKRKRTGPSRYTITMARSQRLGGSEDIIGRVRSNFMGTAFDIHDDGIDPFERPHEVHPQGGSHPSVDSSETRIRRELAGVVYDPNILGFKGPRKMKIVMEQMLPGATQPDYRPTEKSERLLELYRSNRLDEKIVLRNKSPQWSEETQSYVLNFNGRVRLASVKNFQIVNDQDLDYIVMQFGRVTESAFTMDVQYPMSILQAFGIALTSFDAKLACE